MPHVTSCVKRLIPKKTEDGEEEKKKSEDVEKSLQDEMDKDLQSTSAIACVSESFDHLVSKEDYDYWKQIGDEDMQRLLNDFERTGRQIRRMMNQLDDKTLEERRRKWIEDDLNGALRKNESTLMRIRLAEQRKKKEMEEAEKGKK